MNSRYDSLKTLICFGLLFEVLYIALGFLSIYKDRFGDQWIPSLNPEVMIFFSIWVVTIFLAYVYMVIRPPFIINLKIIILFSILFSFTLAISWPLGSSDIFIHLYRSKVFTHYGENPYIVTASQFPNDILESFVQIKAASFAPILQGAVAAWFNALPLFIFRNNLFLVLLGAKLISGALVLASGFFIFKIVEILEPSYKYLGTLLFLWNPYILFEFVQNGHNDILGVLFLLLSLYFILKQRYVYVLPALIFSVFVKYQTVILLPLWIVFLWKKILRKKFSTMIRSLGLTIMLVIVLYLPFWNGFQSYRFTFETLTNPPTYAFSFLPFVFNTLFQFSTVFTKIFGIIVFFIFYIYFLYRIFRLHTTVEFLKYNFWIFIIFYVLAISWIMPWYFVFPVALSFLIKEKKYLYYMLFLILMSLFDYVFLYLLSAIIFIPIFFLFYWIEKRRLLEVMKSLMR